MPEFVVERLCMAQAAMLARMTPDDMTALAHSCLGLVPHGAPRAVVPGSAMPF